MDVSFCVEDPLSLDADAWLADHELLGTVLFPGAGLVELAFHAGDRVGCGTVRELIAEEPLVLPARGALALRVVVGALDGSHGRPQPAHDARAERGRRTRVGG